MFRKRSTRSNGIIQFTCVSCESEHRKSVAAMAQMSYDEDDKEHYSLVSVPDDADHMCWRTGFENYYERAVQKMRALVQEDPTRQIPQIYNSVRQETVDIFDDVGARIALMSSFPSFRSVQSQLYMERRCFIPAKPKSLKPELPQGQVPSQGRVNSHGQQIQPEPTQAQLPASFRGRGRGRGQGEQIQSRTLSVQQKRKSDFSDSIVGQELREKRRRLNDEAEVVAAVIFDSGTTCKPHDPAILVDSNYEVLAPPPPAPARKRGRPKGSKNKPKHPDLRPS